MFIPEIEKAINALGKIEPLYNKILIKYLNLASTQREIIGYNHSQLERGIKSDGKLITPFYASIFYKGRISPVDLKRTGRFYRSFKIDVFENTDVFLFISATDPKTPSLEFKYTTRIFGLSDSSVELFVKNFIPYFKTEMEREIKNLI